MLASLFCRVAKSRTVTTISRAMQSSLTEAQLNHWTSYLATGRGSVALFASIDRNKDQVLTAKEVRAFLEAIDDQQIKVHKVVDELSSRAIDHPVTLQDFQNWLVTITQQSGVSSCIQPHYEKSHYVGDRASKHKTSSLYNWNESTMSQSLRRMQYAVRGEIVMKAEELAKDGRDIIYTNIGNPQAVGQKPMTYFRQVLSLCDLPASKGVDHPNASQMFPSDVIERARELRDIVGPSGTGAYTNSQGLSGIRQHVADYIANRDGQPAYPGDIFLTNGASSGIEMILKGMIAHDTDAIMIPIPQYPIYSALITLLGGRQVGYELDEFRNWTVTRQELDKQLDKAKNKGLDVRGLVMINPGNPTGQVMSRNDVEVICKFCAENGIALLSDEVYQRNIYAKDCEFISAKKIAKESPDCEHLELISFNSTSKGLIGECGRRGGYFELHNIDPYVHSQIYKLASSNLCSCVSGQIMTSLMVRGPDVGSESYALFHEEEQAIFKSLARRASTLVNGLNKIDGISCVPAQGAMYAFPRIDNFPEKAMQAASDKDMTPDTLYALSLLEETGICVVPASGFEQAEGRIGFRTTFLPPEDVINRAVDLFTTHHAKFCDKYA